MIPRVEKIENLKLEILELVFPIGSRYVTQTAEENPANILGFGTWERFDGLIAVGIKEEDSEFNEIGKITGEEKHTMTINELVKHRHTGSLKSNSNVGNYAGIPPMTNNTGSLSTSQSFTDETGDGQPFNIIQPTEVVGYMWIRRS